MITGPGMGWDNRDTNGDYCDNALALISLPPCKKKVPALFPLQFPVTPEKNIPSSGKEEHRAH